MNKTVVLISYLLLIMFISSCAEVPKESNLKKVEEKGSDTLYEEESAHKKNTDNVVVKENTSLEEENIKEYAQLIERIILREHFLDGSIPIEYSRGMIETNFYYNYQNNRISFIIQEDEQVYYLSKYQNYDDYYIERYDLCSEPFNISEQEWLGVYKVNTDIDDSKYKLSELTKEDREDIALVCEDIYQRLSTRQDTFEYNVYIGGFDRGYNDGVEYVTMHLALTGDREFYIRAEIKKVEDKSEVWLLPAPFLPLDSPEPLYQNEEIFKKSINNIVSLNEQVEKLKK